MCAGVGWGGGIFSLFHSRRDSLTSSGITRQDAPDLRAITGHDGETMNGNRKRAARDLKHDTYNISELTVGHYAKHKRDITEH